MINVICKIVLGVDELIYVKKKNPGIVLKGLSEESIDLEINQMPIIVVMLIVCVEGLLAS